MKETVILICVIICIIVGTLWFSKAQCEQRSISFKDSRWGIISGCMVNHNGRWLPLENIRGFDDK